VERPEKNKYLEDVGVDGKILLKWISRRISGGRL
jgi:hypothetical protein